MCVCHMSLSKTLGNLDMLALSNAMPRWTRGKREREREREVLRPNYDHKCKKTRDHIQGIRDWRQGATSLG